MKKNGTGTIIRTAVVLAVASLAACGGGAEEAPEGNPTPLEASAPALAIGDPIPPAGGDAVLDMTGSIGVTNEREILTIDLATLEQMPMVTASIYEPFLEKDIVFEGVLLSDLLPYADVSATGSVEMVALDDYHVVFPVEEMETDRTLIATRASGQAIEISDGGPIRIVFLENETRFSPDTDNWIWSLRSMDFSA